MTHRKIINRSLPAVVLVVLVSGFAAIKMAADGKWFYYYEARSNPPVYKKIRAGDASLKRIIAVEIKTSDILTLLAGRVPLRDHRQALLVDEGSEYKGSVLVLKQRWLGTIEKIYLDENRSQVQAVEFFDRSGNLAYRVRFDRMQVLNGYRVPSRLVITNGELPGRHRCHPLHVCPAAAGLKCEYLNKNIY